MRKVDVLSEVSKTSGACNHQVFPLSPGATSQISEKLIHAKPNSGGSPFTPSVSVSNAINVIGLLINYSACHGDRFSPPLVSRTLALLELDSVTDISIEVDLATYKAYRILWVGGKIHRFGSA